MSFVRNCFLLVLAVLFLLLISEMGYRGYVQWAKPYYRPSCEPGLGWEFSPSTQHGVGQYSYFINDRGFRDRTSGPWIPWTESDVRIAVIGDSVTAGPSVSYEQTYSAQIETLLRHEGLPARVVNLGMDATNTIQHLAILRVKALPLKPQAVILGYFMNDTEIRFWEKMPPPFEAVMGHFHLGVFLRQRIAQVIRARNEETRQPAVEKSAQAGNHSGCAGYPRSILQTYENSNPPENFDRILEMARLAGQRGVYFAVVIFPFEQQVLGICPVSAQDRIKQFLASQGIPFLDLMEPFRKAGPKKLYQKGDPIHLNADGHRLAAETISNWMVSHQESRRGGLFSKKNLSPFSG